jgi:hypothetical protein
MQLLARLERAAAVLFAISSLLVSATALLSVTACSPGESGREQAGAESDAGMNRLPSEFTNLEVLPADISKAELKREMKLMTKSLGVKCDYCHRTDIRDYATDEIEEKVIAREMMRMVERINLEHFTWEGAPEATCFMCHRGDREPRMAPGVRLENAGPN